MFLVVSTGSVDDYLSKDWWHKRRPFRNKRSRAEEETSSKICYKHGQVTDKAVKLMPG